MVNDSQIRSSVVEGESTAVMHSCVQYLQNRTTCFLIHCVKIPSEKLNFSSDVGLLGCERR